MTDTQKTIAEATARYESRKRDSGLLDKLQVLGDDLGYLENIWDVFDQTKDIRLSIELMDKPVHTVENEPIESTDRLYKMMRDLARIY